MQATKSEKDQLEIIRYYVSLDENKEIKYQKEALLCNFYNELSDLLNKLEWFSMNFKYNLADEDVVFASLHQTFLADINYLYYFISKQNSDTCNKLYTHICDLFNRWKVKENENELDYNETINKREEKIKSKPLKK